MYTYIRYEYFILVVWIVIICARSANYEFDKKTKTKKDSIWTEPSYRMRMCTKRNKETVCTWEHVQKK